MGRTVIVLTSKLFDWSERAVVTTAATLLVLLGLLDYASGSEIAFSAIYLLPLLAVGWRVPQRGTLTAFISALASGAWLSAELATRSLNPVVAFWNGASRFAIFYLVVSLLQALRASLIAQQNLAERDPLTGVANQRAFSKAMRRALEASQAARHPISLVYLDLDDFKMINDTLGHSGGNAVLCSFAAALNESTRESDTVGRLGGDEFAIILPSAGTQAARGIMDSLVTRLQGSLSEIHLDRSVTFSAGVVTFLVPPENLDDMINAADSLMYEAKRDGKASYKQATFGGATKDSVPDVHIPRAETVSFRQETMGLTRSSLT